jgi:hypothetical protein
MVYLEPGDLVAKKFLANALSEENKLRLERIHASTTRILRLPLCFAQAA